MDAAFPFPFPSRAQGASETVIQSEGRWLKAPHPSAEARVRVVSVPPAGTGPDHDRPIRPHVPEWIEWWTVCAPGRGVRVGEPAVRDLTEYATEVAAEVASLDSMPMALFGHSMGALVAWEVARLLRGPGGAHLRHLFVSGHSGPSMISASTDHQRTDSELLAMLENEWGGLPEGVRGRSDLEAEMIRRLREDLTILERHEPTVDSPLDLPITALGGLDDPLVHRSALAAWARETKGDFRARQFPGGHAYLTGEAGGRVMAYVGHRLRVLRES